MTVRLADAPLWFDETHAHAAAGVVMLTPDGRVILQVRDDIPEIDNPGRITPFGGGAERHETPVLCALRELAEETGLTPDPGALRFLGAASRMDRRRNRLACTFFLLTGVDPAALAVTEGQAIVMTLDEIAEDPRPTETCRALCAQIARQT